LYAQNADLSLAKNPRLYQNGYTIIVTLGEVRVYLHALNMCASCLTFIIVPLHSQLLLQRHVWTGVSAGVFDLRPVDVDVLTPLRRGTANYESISSFLGFQLDKKTGKFCYVPERFPDNWYRRAVPVSPMVPESPDILILTIIRSLVWHRRRPPSWPRPNLPAQHRYSQPAWRHPA
jgi:hypothetical protein